MADPAGEDFTERSYPEANFVAVRALAGALATTLGPAPRDKLVLGAADSTASLPGNGRTDDYVVTADGATILEHLDIDHPMAPVVRRLAGPERPGETDVEGEDIPDGVTSRLVLAAALLDEAADLLERGIHPAVLREGYWTGLETATETLDGLRLPVDAPGRPEADLAVARTAMTGNDVGGHRDTWARFALEAVDAVGAPTPETFAVRAVRGGSVGDSRLVRGAVLDRNELVADGMPRRAEDATVLVLDGQDEGGLRPLETDDRYEVRATSPEHLEGFRDPDAPRRQRIVERLRGHGVDLVVAKQGIESAYARDLAAHGILGVDGVTPIDLRQVAAATGARPVKHTEGFEAVDLGHAGAVEEVRATLAENGSTDRRMVVIGECAAPGAVTALLQGVWGPLATAATTELRKAAAAIAATRGLGGRRSGVLPGGGATEVRVATALRDRARGESGRQALALEAFADAVEMLPRALARNAGLDPLSVLPNLRAANEGASAPRGLSLPDGDPVDALEAGLLDPFAVRHDVYVSAVEVSALLLGIDDALEATRQDPAPDPDDAVYEDAAEQQQSYLADHDDTRWST